MHNIGLTMSANSSCVNIDIRSKTSIISEPYLNFHARETLLKINILFNHRTGFWLK